MIKVFYEMQQGMCLMDVTNLHPKWKIYNVPTQKVVSYSFLLKQKREFQQFISRLKSEVSNMGSCCILDKTSVTSCEKELNVYIFDKSVGFNSLHLKVILPKQNLRKKITLLIHLASKNNAMSRLQNLCMYIKCKECNLWETFYNMFAFLLKKSCQNLIGTQFYVSLVCKGMMANERKLLHSLGRFFNAKSKQTCAEISFIPFIHAQKNISNFVKSQKPIMQLTDIIRAKAKALPCPDHMLKPINVPLKRKFNNTGNDKSVKTLKVSHEFCKKLSCDCHERNKWKVYKQITWQPVVNYIDLLKADFDFSDMEYSEFYTIPPEDFRNPKSLYVNENYTKTTSETELFQTGNIYNRKPKDKANEMRSSQINSKILSNQAIVDKTKNVSYSECKNRKEIEQSSESLNITLVANEHKKFENERTCMPLPNSIQVPARGFQSCNINMNVGKLFKGFQSTSSSIASAAPKAFQSSSTSNFCVRNPEVVGFQTAAGKSLNISEKAILAAQKMFDEVCSQEINLFDKDEAANSSKSKKPVYPVENNIDNEFNSDLADKFFEEFPFDEKEGEFESKVNPPQPTLLKLDNKVSQVGKVRKSLGGRRSLKPYSVKK